MGEVGHAFNGKVTARDAFLHPVDVHGPMAACLVQPFLRGGGCALVPLERGALRRVLIWAGSPVGGQWPAGPLPLARGASLGRGEMHERRRRDYQGSREHCTVGCK